MKRTGVFFLSIIVVWAVAKLVGYFLTILPRIAAAAIDTLEMLGLMVSLVAGCALVAFVVPWVPRVARILARQTSRRRTIRTLHVDPGRGVGGRRDSWQPGFVPYHPHRNEHETGAETASPSFGLSFTEGLRDLAPNPQPGSVSPESHRSAQLPRSPGGFDPKSAGTREQPLIILPQKPAAPDRTALPCITIVVEPATALPPGLDGAVGIPAVHADRVDILVIGDHTNLHSQVQYKVKELRIDTKTFASRLSNSAKEALADLARNPGDKRAEEAFLRRLPRRGRSCAESAAQFRTGPDAVFDIVRFDVLVVGDHNQVSSETEHRITIGTIPLQNLLSTHRELITEFAQALHDPAKEADFNQSLNHAVDMMAVITDQGFAARGRIRSATRTPGGGVRVDEPIALIEGRGTRVTMESAGEVYRTKPVRDFRPIRKDLHLRPTSTSTKATEERTESSVLRFSFEPPAPSFDPSSVPGPENGTLGGPSIGRSF